MSESRRLLPVVCAFLTASLLAACNGGDDPTSVIDDIRQAARDSSFLQLEQSVAVDELLPAITERGVMHSTASWRQEGQKLDLEPLIHRRREALQACIRGELAGDEVRRCETVDYMLTFAGIRPDEFAGADVVERTDSVASLRLRFENPRLDTIIALRVRTERQGAGWKIVDTENLSSVASTVQGRQRSILQVVNDSLRPVIREKLPIRSHVSRSRDDASSSIYHVRLSVILKNRSDQPITHVSVRVGGGVRNGTFPESRSRTGTDRTAPLAPGDSVDLHKTNRLGWYHVCDDLGYGDDLCDFEDGASPEVEVASVRFADGSWLGLHDDWYSYAFRNESEERRSEE